MIDFDIVFAEWVSQRFHDAEWDESVIHASDLGTCPRMVWYRLHGGEKRQETEKQQATRTRMLWEARVAHERWGEMLADMGLLRDYELAIPSRLGLRCRADAIIHDGECLRLVDLKTVRPNAMRYDLPKPHHVLQVHAYFDGILTSKLRDEYDGAWGDPMLVYWPVGGRAPSVACTVPYTDAAKERLKKAVEELQTATYDDPPEKLSPILKAVYKRRKSASDPRELSEIQEVLHWNCSTDWCPYMINPKHPEMGGECIPQYIHGERSDRQSSRVVARVVPIVDSRGRKVVDPAGEPVTELQVVAGYEERVEAWLNERQEEMTEQVMNELLAELAEIEEAWGGF